ncbi:hypothetical protein KJ966_24595 [bacterium]|nr:hypothetical protein [bacterium]
MANKKNVPETDKQDPKVETAQRESNATRNLRTMARPGNRAQFFRMLAMQKPVKQRKQKETDK